MSVRRPIAAFALVASVFVSGCSREPSGQQVRAWEAEIQRLQAEQDSLRARAQEIVAQDPRLKRLPEGDVVISVPTKFVRDVIDRVFEDVAGNVTLRLEGIKAHVSKTVKKIVTIGQFTVDVDIQEVVGKLKPRKPDMKFAGSRIAMTLPVDVSEGTGRAAIHFVWDGKNVAGVACGDMDVTKVVTGNVIPSRYLVSGALDLGMRGKQVVCTPRFPETKVRVQVKASKKSWASIDSLLDEKRGVCGYVLDKVDVPALLKNLTEEKGFSVKLPFSKLKPFAIPAGVQDSVRVGERVLAVQTSTNAIDVQPDAILYSARVTLK